jgi:hypothetical protein
MGEIGAYILLWRKLSPTAQRRTADLDEGINMRCIDPAMRKVLATYQNYTNLQLEDGGKHVKLRNITTKDWIPVAGSSSDRRAAKNFDASLYRLTTFGQGLIFAKTGHLPH